MNYLPELRGALVEAAHRQRASAQRPVRHRGAAILRQRSALGWAATIVSIVLGLGGAAVVGVFKAGTPIGPEVQPSPVSGYGVTVPGSVKLLPFRVPDPGGGPSWGMRVMRTTRGLTCVQIGRVEFGTVGVLGEDGAFADDHRFHPLSDNRFLPFDCGVADANGNAFLNVFEAGLPASGLVGASRSIGGCLTAGETNTTLHLAKCPAADVRDIYYGLLGPDAVSITYRAGDGRLVTTATGSDGAYLVVLPYPTDRCAATQGPPCLGEEHGVRAGTELLPGTIASVRYRDGHSCSVPAKAPPRGGAGHCLPVGFVPAPTARFTAAQLRAPITVREVPAKLYCEVRTNTIEPCGRHTPPGVRRLAGGQPSLLVDISFVSRVSIPDTSSYEHELRYPPSHGCTIGGTGGPTLANIHAGERVLMQDLVPYSCPGVIHGTIRYRPSAGPAGPLTPGGIGGEAGDTLVGKFSLRVP
jgi:hypothetical protein